MAHQLRTLLVVGTAICQLSFWCHRHYSKQQLLVVQTFDSREINADHLAWKLSSGCIVFCC